MLQGMRLSWKGLQLRALMQAMGYWVLLVRLTRSCCEGWTRCEGLSWSWSRRRGLQLHVLLQAMRYWVLLVRLTKSCCEGWR